MQFQLDLNTNNDNNIKSLLDYQNKCIFVNGEIKRIFPIDIENILNALGIDVYYTDTKINKIIYDESDEKFVFYTNGKNDRKHRRYYLASMLAKHLHGDTEINENQLSQFVENLLIPKNDLLLILQHYKIDNNDLNIMKDLINNMEIVNQCVDFFQVPQELVIQRLNNLTI